MITRYHITVGAKTTVGGEVTATDSFRLIGNRKVAYAGDPVSCPKCNAIGLIQPDGPRLSDTFNGKQVALSDDVCRCKCDPPPRLIADQNFSFQMVDADWHAAQVGAVAKTAAQLNSAASNSTTVSEGIPVVLLDPKTEEPNRNRRYKLELTKTVIEGTTDSNGATRPLTQAERASIVRWHVEDEPVSS